MRGRREGQQNLFIILNLEDRAPMDHPLRKIKSRADGVLAEMTRDFTRAYQSAKKLDFAQSRVPVSGVPLVKNAVEGVDSRWLLEFPGGLPGLREELASARRQFSSARR